MTRFFTSRLIFLLIIPNCYCKNHVKQQSRMIEDFNQTTSRRINDLEGDSKQIEKRVEQTARNEGQRALDTSDSIAKG